MPELEVMLGEMDAFLAKGAEGEAAAKEAAEAKAPDGVKVETPDTVEAAKKNASKPKKTAVEAATALVPKVSDVPVPTGGVGLLLFIILLIVFSIMPAPGQDGLSRLALLWKAFIGQADLGNSAPASSSGKDMAPADNVPGTLPGSGGLIQGGFY